MKRRIDDDGRECTKCEIYKPWTEFNKQTDGVKGRRSRCRDCQKAYDRSYQRDFVKHKQATRKYYLKNKEKYRQRARADYIANNERHRETARAYYQRNLETRREYSRKYYHANLEARREYARLYKARKRAEGK